MSEKRHRTQQRRQRRKAQASARSRKREITLDRLLAELAQLAAQSIEEVTDGLDAECWASSLLATWQREAQLVSLFAGALEALGTPSALAALRALNAVGAPGAGAAADRLAAAGRREPAWAADVGRSRPVAAALLEEPAFDDGVSVMIEFAEAGGDTHTLSVYIDHNLGGFVKDALLAGPLAGFRDTLDRAPDRDRAMWRELDLVEARARIETALEALDHTFEPPVDEDVYALRALVEARLRLLPGGFELPDPYVEVPRADRDALLADFLDAEEGRRWRGDEDAEFAAQLAIDFGCDYNYGGPLRWSPVVVEIFMLDWLARKVSEEPEFFARVPEVLATWVAYAGRRRGVPVEMVGEAVEVVEAYRDEMLDTVGDPEAWGPAKVLAAAASEAGVDLSDSEAVERFVQGHPV